MTMLKINSQEADRPHNATAGLKSEWSEVKLGEIFEISSSKRVFQKQWKSSGVPFYRAREIVKLAQNGSVENDLFISEDLFYDYKRKYGVPEPGDLMISAVGTLGACYVVQPGDKFYFKDASVLRFSPKQPIHSRFIQHAFQTRQIIDQINAGSGSTVGTLTISRAKNISLKIPPQMNKIVLQQSSIKPMNCAACVSVPSTASTISARRFSMRCLGIGIGRAITFHWLNWALSLTS